ncbi:MAG: 3-oxoacyl-[acyl-carrier-protein] reductase [Candidatus Latescibacteria bacterium]|jgi:3-oxoacyl-[acyl-carrier protein] reductase|nr:3-oxoacyl-[acyl-carrier-protein] reductase [Candidatus Latescibacterota bacterium]
MNLSNKCVLVTGGSRGIGKAIAVVLAEYGAHIAVNYVEDENGENLRDAENVRDQIASLGRKVTVLESDVSNYKSVSRMAKKVIDEFGKIDILINNAAIIRDKTLKKMSEEEWSSVIDINLTGVFNCSRAVIEHMIDNNRGRIVNISSISGQTGFFGQTNYTASKAGVVGFTKSLAREVAAKNITINAVAPGIVGTEMAKQIPENVVQEFLKQIPMGRFAQPEEIAELVAFLVSDKASYITGQTIHINGGWYM